ncbi:MAG: D-glycero-beta-D-manno-heptose-7-phosphate kinase [bacterium]
MNGISASRLNELKNRFYGKRVAVVGDMMLDCYFWGDVHRISPEAPVPIVEIDNEFFRFGGASNVAYNIIKLGGSPIPIGVIGDDNSGSIFNALMKESNISSEGIFVDSSRPTTSKTRVIAADQHVVRIDREHKNSISAETETKIVNFVTERIDTIDAIIFQDYNKGVITKTLIHSLIALAKKNSKIVTVDPKFNNFVEYKNATVFKPNRKETEDAFGIRISTEEDIRKACEMLLDKLKAKYILLTLGKDGIALFEKDKPLERISTVARKARDVSGAGDTVISTLTVALAAGADIHEAAYLANYAGGIVCEEVGIVPIEIDKLFSTVGALAK